MNRAFTFLFLIAVSLPLTIRGENQRNNVSANQRANSNLGFVENKGQFRDHYGKPNPDVLYIADFGGMKVLLRKDGFSYETYEIKPKWIDPASIPYKVRTISSNGDTIESWPGMEEAKKNLLYHFHRVDVKAVGANPEAIVNPEILVGDLTTYVFPEENGLTKKVNTYEQIRVKDLYPGIDVVYYAKHDGEGFKYDLILNESMNLTTILFEYSGAHSLHLDPSGKLLINTKLGEIHETIPHSYALDIQNNQTTNTKVNFSLVNNQLSFKNLEKAKGRLVIDPLINWISGTYLGGVNPTISNSINALSNSVLVSGATSSYSNIATQGAFQDSLLLTEDGFLNKFNETGTQLEWGTYLNGFRATKSHQKYDKIAITGPEGIMLFDTLGNFRWSFTNAYIQKNIVINNSHEIIAVGDSIYCFNESGNVKWKRDFGLSQTQINGVCVDLSDNVYITGTTAETYGIATVGAHQSFFGGVRNILLGPGPIEFSYDYNLLKGDAFLAKLTKEGQRVWSTYIGGENLDFGISCAVKDSMLVVTGMTNSVNEISSTNSFQPALSPNMGYCFFQINYGSNPCTNPWQWFFCGECQNGGYCPQPYDTCCQCADQFLMLFDLNGSKQWGTYLGDNYTEKAASALFDNQGNIVVSGTTYCVNTCISSLSTANSWINIKDQGISGYCLSYTTAGNRRYGTYIPNGFDYSYMSYGGLRINDMDLSENDMIVLTGTSHYEALITDTNAYRPQNGIYNSGLGNGFFLCLSTSKIDSIKHTSNHAFCPGDNLLLECLVFPTGIAGIDYSWYHNNHLLINDTLPQLHKNNLQSVDTGWYKCYVNDNLLVLESDSIKLEEITKPVFAITETLTGNTQVHFYDYDNDGILDLLGDSVLYLGCQLMNASTLNLHSINHCLPRIKWMNLNEDSIPDAADDNQLWLSDTLGYSRNPFETWNTWNDFDNNGAIDGIVYVNQGLSILSIPNDFSLKSFGNVSGNYFGYPDSFTQSADLDKDSDIDILRVQSMLNSDCSGNFGCNNNGIFLLINQSNSFKDTLLYSFYNNESNAKTAIGDLDADGDLDFVVVTRYYQFPEHLITTRIFLNQAMQFEKKQQFDIRCENAYDYYMNSPCLGDIDGDGRLDLFAGKYFFQNTDSGFVQTTTSLGITMEGVDQPVQIIADIDRDGLLDVASPTKIFKQTRCSEANTLPTAPGLFDVLIENDTIHLTWQRTTDLETPQLGLTYNMRVGTTPCGNDIMSSLSDSTGWRKVVGMGNVYQNTGWWLHGLAPGTYYWSVQAIDNSFAGGPFAEEQTFTIPGIKIRVFPEGLLNTATGILNKSHNATGEQFSGNIADKIIIELHDATAPYNLIGSPVEANLLTTGYAQFIINTVLPESFYIVVKHRNSIETWSALPVSNTNGLIQYDFTQQITSAFGQNLKQVGSGFGLFSGDINQDGIVDALDYTILDNQAANNIKGYLPEDINGDGSVDVFDMLLLENNANEFIGVKKP